MQKNKNSEPIDKKNDVFNPLDKKQLGKSLLMAILSEEFHSLQELGRFRGAGIYAIYYKGDFPLYKPLKDAFNERKLWPIYVGKAVPKGSRKGNASLDSHMGSALQDRLNHHRQSIEEADNLDVKDFLCQYLKIDDIWIPLGESVLIQETKPLWNNVVEGFGIKEPGAGRKKQKRSTWDTLHPGRKIAENLPEGKKTISEIEESIKVFFENSLH